MKNLLLRNGLPFREGVALCGGGCSANTGGKVLNEQLSRPRTSRRKEAGESVFSAQPLLLCQPAQYGSHSRCRGTDGSEPERIVAGASPVLRPGGQLEPTLDELWQVLADKEANIDEGSGRGPSLLQKMREDKRSSRAHFTVQNSPETDSAVLPGTK